MGGRVGFSFDHLNYEVPPPHRTTVFGFDDD